MEGFCRHAGGASKGGRYEGQEEGIDHRPAEERERVCTRILLLKLWQLGVTGRYVSSVLA